MPQVLYLPMDSDFDDVVLHTVNVNETLISPSNMTSNSAPSPFVSSASSSWEGDTNWRIWYAFDSYIGSSPSGHMGWNLQGATGWIKIDMGKAYPISKYRIYSTSHNVCPRDWTLEGSNTGAFSGEEDILDTRADIDNWGADSYVEYSFTLTSPYRYFRINITDVNSTNAYIGQIQLYGKPMIDTSIKEVGAGSGKFVSSLYNGVYIDVEAIGDEFYGDKHDWMIKFHLYLASHPPNDPSLENFYFICGYAYDGNNRWGILYFEDDIYDPYYSQGFMVYSVNSGSLHCRVTSDSTLTLETWYDVEIRRVKGNIIIKIDDVEQTVGGTQIGDKAFGNIADLYIGKNTLYGFPMWLDGNIDEFEFWKYTEGNWIGINF